MDGNKTGAFIVTKDASLSVLKNNKRIYVAKLKQGNIFQKVNEQGNWLEVLFGNEIGYIWKPATEETSFTFSNNKVIGELLTVIETPLFESTEQSVPAAVIEAGEALTQTEKVNDKWYAVLIAGRKLYIESKCVTELNNLSFKENYHPYFNIIKKYIFDSSILFDGVSKSEDEILSDANLMLNDKIRFPNFNKGIPMDFSNGIDWTKGQNIEEEFQRSFLRQLHGLFFIDDLVEAFYVTKDERYITKGYEYIEKWKNYNPYHKPESNMAWHDEGTARRLSVLVNFFEAGKKVLDDKKKKNLFLLMVFHASLLSKDSFHAKNTNHGMFQDEALIVFSKYFYEVEIFSNYYYKAIKRLKEYFDSLISADGVHLEHSPHYHQLVAGSLQSYAEALSRFGDSDAVDFFFNKYKSMAHYATHVIKPDGKWPLIADTYGTSKPVAILWEDSPYYQYSVTKGRAGEVPLETNAVFPEAGYAIFRDQWGTPDEGAYIFFTAAYHTNYHKHSDDLSMWIYDGQDIITESGPHSYTLSDPITSYAYSSYAHNTLIVDDTGLPRVDGKYNQTYLEEYSINDSLKPSVTGVNKRYSGVIHRRHIIYDKTKRIIKVNDSMESKDNHNHKLLWHLAPDVSPIIDHKNNKITLKKNEKELMRIHFVSDQAIKLSSVFGNEDDIYKSWTFDNTKENTIIDVHTLIVEMDNNSGEVQTTFELQSK